MLQTTYLHTGWEFAEKSWPGGQVATIDTGWLPATVPGHVHLDLVDNGIIADPFRRMNELGCQWVDERDWSYRTTFEWQPKDGLPRRILRFEGLDTVCSIYLNGELVGEHDNMFVPHEIDVTDKLKEGSNELRVEFQSAVRVGNERRKAYLSKKGLADDTLFFDERAFVRKAQYMYGWDWGPRLVSCGIWRSVSLIEFASRILDFRVMQNHLESGDVELTFEVDYVGDGFTPWFYCLSDEPNVRGYLSTATTLRIDRPIFWLPKAPFRYDFGVELKPSRKSGDRLSKESSGAFDWWEDSVCLGIGIVNTRLLRQPDQFGESFEFEVNGQKIWARGANWIPDHSFPSIVTRAQYRDRLLKAKDMGFNMLRVWGGGLYETDEFYELCDELGILVWQDFPFACSYYPDDEEWQKTIRDEATANLKRLRNHPCLALWCGNNENLEMHVNTWGGPERHPKRYYGSNLYDNVLPQVVAELNPEISYIPTSPIGENPNNDGKAAKQTGPNSGGYGDQHCWDVWHGRGDWRHYLDSTGRFSSEYGFASSCSKPTWLKTLDEADWDPHSNVVQWHDRTAKGHETFHGYVKLHYPEPRTLEDWVYYSQLNQRDALRCGVEHFRRSEFCRGSLIWQLNDCWPVQSWSILDCDGHYKALAYDLRRLYHDHLVSIVRDTDQITVWAINDGARDMADEYELIATELSTGKELMRWAPKEEVLLKPNSRRPIIEASVRGLSTPDVLLTVWNSWVGAESWMLLAEPKAARFAPPCPLTISTYHENSLAILATSPLVDLMLTENGSPDPFIDNFIATPDTETVFVRVKYTPKTIEARSMAGIHSVKITRSLL